MIKLSSFPSSYTLKTEVELLDNRAATCDGTSRSSTLWTHFPDISVVQLWSETAVELYECSTRHNRINTQGALESKPTINLPLFRTHCYSFWLYTLFFCNIVIFKVTVREPCVCPLLFLLFRILSLTMTSLLEEGK